MNDAVQDIMAWEYNEMDGQQLCYCMYQLRSELKTLRGQSWTSFALVSLDVKYQTIEKKLV